MAYAAAGKARIGRSKYWAMFGINIALVAGLIIGAVSAAASGNLRLAVILFLLMGPVGMYFRVVMMRRCRDIGWPAFLPWLFFGMGMVAQMARFSGGVESLASPTSLAVPLTVGLLDFAFMIVIGCIEGKGGEDYARAFYDETDRPIAARPLGAAQGADRDANWDAAIARALAAHQRGESVLDNRPGQGPASRPAEPARLPQPGPSLPGQALRPAGGFGRRAV